MHRALSDAPQSILDRDDQQRVFLDMHNHILIDILLEAEGKSKLKVSHSSNKRVYAEQSNNAIIIN